MVTHSVNSLPNHKLINFNVPQYLIKNFDNLVRFKRVSRTSMLIQLMETYIRSERKLLEEDDGLNVLINDVENRNLNKIKRDLLEVSKEVQYQNEPPMIPHLSDNNEYIWDGDDGLDRLWSLK